jgi:25S rRNA (cytosine2278-C5)-methyltransferase
MWTILGLCEVFLTGPRTDVTAREPSKFAGCKKDVNELHNLCCIRSLPPQSSRQPATEAATRPRRPYKSLPYKCWPRLYCYQRSRLLCCRLALSLPANLLVLNIDTAITTIRHHQTAKMPPHRQQSSQAKSKSLYQPAASLLDKVWQSSNPKQALKTVVYDKQGRLLCTPTVYAQVSQVLQYASLLTAILGDCQDWASPEQVTNQSLLYVLVYEVLLGRHKTIRGGGRLRRLVMEHLADLQDLLSKHQTTSAGQSFKFPRYARVNRLVTDLQTVNKQLPVDCRRYIDPIVPDLMVFESSATSLYLHPLGLVDGSLVLQDRSSCLPALCMVHGYTDNGADSQNTPAHVLDACAAPGNKTSHWAGLLHQKPVTIHALERNQARCNVMTRRLDQLKCRLASDNDETTTGVSVRIHHGDFLQVQPEKDDWAALVSAILLDPTCSGSGVNNGQSDIENDASDSDRLAHLHNFQVTCLQHALTSFPKVTRVVYSTCSIHTTENESVVAEVLNKVGSDWKLIAPVCMQGWKRRGQVVDGLTAEQAACLIRADWQDETNGFFVACFERTIATESDDHAVDNERKMTKSKKTNQKKGRTAQDPQSESVTKDKVSQMPTYTSPAQTAKALELELYNGQFATAEFREALAGLSESSTGKKKSESAYHNSTSSKSGQNKEKQKSQSSMVDKHTDTRSSQRDSEPGLNHKKHKPSATDAAKAPQKKQKTASTSAPSSTATSKQASHVDKPQKAGKGNLTKPGTDTDTNKSIPKKVAKKLAWKQRQSQNKQSRLAKKTTE